MELAIVGGRSTQGMFALRDGETGKAYGYFGEAALALMGVSMSAMSRYKEAARRTHDLPNSATTARPVQAESKIVQQVDEPSPPSNLSKQNVKNETRPLEIETGQVKTNIPGNAHVVAPTTKAPLYEVDTAYNLRKNPAHGVATDTIAEHSPQTKWARDLIPGHSDVNKVGREPAIRVTTDEAEAITRAETLTNVPASARDALATKIRILREHTNAPNSALQDLIRLNKQTHPWDYMPLHRMELP